MNGHLGEGCTSEQSPADELQDLVSPDEIDKLFTEEMKRRNDKLIQVKSRAWATQLETEATEKENRKIRRELLKEQVNNRVLAVEEMRLRISVLELRPEVAAMAKEIKEAYLTMIALSHEQRGRTSECPTPTSSSSSGIKDKDRATDSPPLQHKDLFSSKNDMELEKLRCQLADLKRMLQESSEACREEEKAVTALQEHMSSQALGSSISLNSTHAELVQQDKSLSFEHESERESMHL